ncbi:hypothetical protein [Humibacillus xanthopallidus]|uniref:Uncharacterized protein n=1 Tax=Humibacillus xanthopallidus TaxID=412689 RepID=A0A543I2Y0_9MICO|nr:hypothetical protein [Humibacillus xanthopallidus]TQM64935.1 hypothetical protein FBY41_1317 [Humibacillus xanthopallidus]
MDPDPGDRHTHAYANTGAEEAWFSLTVFEPGVGRTARTEVSHD